jgi:stage III sporulation protein AD
MINILTLCGITVLSVVIIVFLKKVKSDFALPLSFLLGILLLRQALHTLEAGGGLLKKIFENNPFSEYGNLILKAFGISIAVELLSEFCRDAGENSISAKIELLGKIEIIILSLPLIEKILDIVKNIIM